MHGVDGFIDAWMDRLMVIPQAMAGIKGLRCRVEKVGYSGSRYGLGK